MKKILQIISVLLLSVFMFLTGCNKMQQNTTTTTITGSWKISSLSKNNVDLTSQYTSYTMSLYNNGQMNIAGNGNSYSGTWSWGQGCNYSSCIFILTGVGVNNPLYIMNQTWNLGRCSNSTRTFSNNGFTSGCAMTWQIVQ